MMQTRPHRIILVLQDEGNSIRGFVVGAEVAGEWELENIAVDRAVRRAGLGAQLMRAFLDELLQAGAESVFLEVRASNVAACGLYERWGFEVVGRRAGYYRNPDEDATVYKKNLQKA